MVKNGCPWASRRRRSTKVTCAYGVRFHHGGEATSRGATRSMRTACDISISGSSLRPDVLVDEQLPSPPQQERSRRARDGLLAAALSRFAESGYEATTVEEIAKRAGVAVGGFYNHFRSKRQVLLVLMDLLLRELDARLGSGKDTARHLEHLCFSLHFDSSYAGAYRAWREAALRDAALAALDGTIEAWTCARITAALRGVSMKPGTRANVDLHALGWMLSVLSWRLLQAPKVDPVAVTQTAVAFVELILFKDGVRSNDGVRRRIERLS